MTYTKTQYIFCLSDISFRRYFWVAAVVFPSERIGQHLSFLAF